MQGDGLPKLFWVKYLESNRPSNKDRIPIVDKLEVLVRGPKTRKKDSVEAFFRKFLEEHKNIIPDADLSKTRFNKREIRANGGYWNTSVLVIPIKNSENYYKISYFS